MLPMKLKNISNFSLLRLRFNPATDLLLFSDISFMLQVDELNVHQEGIQTKYGSYQAVPLLHYLPILLAAPDTMESNTVHYKSTLPVHDLFFSITMEFKVHINIHQ